MGFWVSVLVLEFLSGFDQVGQSIGPVHLNAAVDLVRLGYCLEDDACYDSKPVEAALESEEKVGLAGVDFADGAIWEDHVKCFDSIACKTVLIS